MNTKKTLIATLALATFLASPAFAQSSTHRVRHANAPVDNVYASEGYASAQNPNVVIFSNRVVGQDPDINIRSQMIRDPNPAAE
jgi:hypothetical protein